MNFCCKDMSCYVSQDDICFFYDPQRRAFAIWCNHFESYYVINNCPWCGAKLPKELGDEFADIVYGELGFDPLDINLEEKLPAEFKTDAWWKKRGL